ncbi:DHHC zinc finger domain-containing protein [Toxoplasma gondii TgCatPRC2]|uniref:Palmitoyltransferase n=1 Tax=Toxoplasma gondii TgCatPRC2 TaxID=1130821 RepID=A0A151H067_TOXGO|nr:DHHC zinc finger domain-containing protein [Toxoplasma gondii TgCatPRC2]
MAHAPSRSPPSPLPPTPSGPPSSPLPPTPSGPPSSLPAKSFVLPSTSSPSPPKSSPTPLSPPQPPPSSPLPPSPPSPPAPPPSAPSPSPPSSRSPAEHLYELAAERHPARCTAIDRSDSRPPDEEIRRDGFSRPLQAFQILSWLCFAADVFLFYLVLVPSMCFALQVAGGVAFGLCAVAVFACGWIATTTDPIDPVAFLSGPFSSAPAPEVHPDMRECDVCGFVHERSKHCRVCNKCVDGFDHHCMWINNCVGEKNYRPFFALLVFTAAMTAAVFLLAVGCVVEEAVWGSAGERWRAAYGWFASGAFYALLALPIALNGPLFALVAQLLALHIYLVRHHLTTFEYITLRVHEEDPAPSGAPEKKKLRAWAEWIVIDRQRLRRAKKRGLMRDLSDVSQCTPVRPADFVPPRDSLQPDRHPPERCDGDAASPTPGGPQGRPSGVSPQLAAPSPALHDCGSAASPVVSDSVEDTQKSQV